MNLMQSPLHGAVWGWSICAKIVVTWRTEYIKHEAMKTIARNVIGGFVIIVDWLVCEFAEIAKPLPNALN